jgi:hypothetical protein
MIRQNLILHYAITHELGTDKRRPARDQQVNHDFRHGNGRPSHDETLADLIGMTVTLAALHWRKIKKKYGAAPIDGTASGIHIAFVSCGVELPHYRLCGSMKRSHVS